MLFLQRIFAEHLLADVAPGAGDAAVSCPVFPPGAPLHWKRWTIRSFIPGSAEPWDEDTLACAMVRGWGAVGLLHAAWAGRTRRTWPLSWKMRGSEPSKCSWQENSQCRNPEGRAGAHRVWPGPGPGDDVRKMRRAPSLSTSDGLWKNEQGPGEVRGGLTSRRLKGPLKTVGVGMAFEA